MMIEPWRDELYHHGTKGQKWGIRRYQNPDGTLTELGKRRQRYSHGENDAYNRGTSRVTAVATSVTRLMSKNPLGAATSLGRYVTKGGKGREKRLTDKLENSRRNLKSGNLSEQEQKKEIAKAAKLNKKIEAQRKANEARDLYDSYTSNGKMIAQDLLLGYDNAEMYRNARARGAARVRALLESGMTNPVSAILRGTANKKRYGDWFVASDGSSEELYGRDNLY